jgi:GT2 family glycosyltransferase
MNRDPTRSGSTATTGSSSSGDDSVCTVVVVLTVDQLQITKRLLDSLMPAIDSACRVLVWDNGSSDGTIESLRSQFPWVHVCGSAQNLGVAVGRNRAAQKAIDEWNPQFLLFIDNDMTVDAGFLPPLEAPFSADPSLAQTTAKIRDLNWPERLYGAGGCRIRFWLGDTTHVGSGQLDRGQFDDAKACIPSGGCMLVRATSFEHLGGFDEIFSPYGPEDLDFGLRARKAGLKALYVPHSIVFHESTPGRTFESGTYSETYATHRSRHWFQFMNRHASIPQKAGFFIIGAPYRLLVLAFREAKKGNLGSAIKGLLRGARDSRHT